MVEREIKRKWRIKLMIKSEKKIKIQIELSAKVKEKIKSLERKTGEEKNVR